jgi:VCBS repeat-containing protein
VKLSNILDFKLYTLVALLSLMAPEFIYAENCPDNAISYWKLDETSTFSFEDSIGTNVGSCASVCPTAEQNDGAVNGSKRFSGSSGIDVPAAAGFDWPSTSSFSIEMWVKRTTSTLNANGEVLIGRIDPASSLEWRVEIRDVAGQGHRAAFKLVDTNGNGDAESLIAVGGKPIVADIWHHIVAVRDAATNTNMLYVDGQLDAQKQNVQYSAGFDSATADVNIGWIAGTVARPLNGLLDEVAVYRRVLTEQEIRSHYYLSRGYCAELDTDIGIMPMGNSITKDRVSIPETRPDNQRVGYRKTLYNQLFDNYYGFDITGSEGDKNDGDITEFDIDHAGWGGMRTSHLLDVLDDGVFISPDAGVGEVNLLTNGPYLGDFKTDVILLHIGSNDVGSEISVPVPGFPDQPMANLDDILEQIDNADERITVLLAQIISRSDDTNPSKIDAYNTALRNLAENRIDAGDKIILVDMEPVLSYPGDLRDGIHPTPSGYVKMGNHWYQVLETFLPPFIEPNITSAPVTAVDRDQLYSYQVESEGTGPLTYRLVSNSPQDMTISDTGVIEWTPKAAGTYDVTVRVTNDLPFDRTGTDEQTFEIEVAANASPVGADDAYTVAQGGTLNVSAAQGVLANDSDADSGDTLTAVRLSAPSSGSLTLNDDGSFTYVHDGGDQTVDTFTYAASDGKSQSSAVTVTLNIESGDVTPGTGGSSGGGGGGCFISAAGLSGSHAHDREMMMIGALAALGILVLCVPAVSRFRRRSTMGN